MKTLATLLGLAAVSLIPAFAESSQTPRPAPEFAVNMPMGGQMLLSSYHGKSVCLAFFYTTCPHCQDMSRLLSQIQTEYAPKGVQILAAAFDPDAKTQVADFAKQYVKGFPIGWADRGQVYEFLQKSVMTPLYVPIMVFVDRKGTIMSEYLGDPTFLADPGKNVRLELDKLIVHAPAGKAPTHLSKK